MNAALADKDKINSRPIKFVLWLIIVSVVMLFGGLTSAYIVRQGEGNWLIFELPRIFWLSTALIVLSSVSMHWAYLSAKKFELGKQKIGLWITFILGSGFLVGQYIAWLNLIRNKIFLVGNPSSSFLYVISGLHALHIIAGLIFVLMALVGVYRGLNQTRNVLRMEMCSIFWHFLDILWIYLFVFLLLTR